MVSRGLRCFVLCIRRQPITSSFTLWTQEGCYAVHNATLWERQSSPNRLHTNKPIKEWAHYPRRSWAVILKGVTIAMSTRDRSDNFRFRGRQRELIQVGSWNPAPISNVIAGTCCCRTHQLNHLPSYSRPVACETYQSHFQPTIYSLRLDASQSFQRFFVAIQWLTPSC